MEQVDRCQGCKGADQGRESDEPEVVRYLFVHELCHLIALNHSRKFWSAVARFEPGYEELDRRLTQGWNDIPLWAHPEAR